MEDNELIHETPSGTPEFRTELARQLAELMPEVVADGKIDTVKLKELLAEDAGDDVERFGLFWPGKRRALKAAQERTTATLRPDKENSKDWDTTKNIFIEGDNLEVLKILQKHYHNKIKLIYIDPPYNTGKDFVYPDNYREGLATYLEWTRQVNEEGRPLSSNPETGGRYHSNWLNMMYPRLKLARNLLAEDGLIFISIDDNEVAQLRRVCDELFGEDNFRNQIVVRRGPKSVQAQFDTWDRLGQAVEWILLYSRSSKHRFSQQRRDLEDERPGSWNNHWRGTDRRSMRYTLLGKEITSGQWRWGKSRSEVAVQNYIQLLRDLEVEGDEVTQDQIDEWFVSKEDPSLDLLRLSANGNPEHYIPPTRDTLLNSSWHDLLVGNSSEVKRLFGAAVFDTPKLSALVRRMLQFTDSNAIVLDFFAGSGTTAHAVMAKNAEDQGARTFIQVQLPEPTPEGSVARNRGYKTIAEVARRRIELAGERIKEEAGLQGEHLDIGFRAYRLCDTNFTKWQVSSDTDRTALEQHLLDLRESARDDATADDLLTEVLLKQGHSLSESIVDAQIEGLPVKVVGEQLIIAYLDETVKPTLAQLRALVAQDPQRIIVLEDAFQGDDELKTNLAQLCKSKGIELWTA
ncbi:MAG: site-specific DNA-methyltransferase [Fimbriimonadaceae bacterium]|jgi:adenine-specific DNA-methyltransferase|nr:site-specific DNA-methyltransferase [Fimbriimonadaceae bacterium]